MIAYVPVYFYETEIEWIGVKDLQVLSGKPPGIAAGAPYWTISVPTNDGSISCCLHAHKMPMGLESLQIIL